MFLPSLIFSSIGLLSASIYEWPSYLPRCSLSDPNLNQCAIKVVNSVIPRIAKGDDKLGIPSVSPVCFSEAPAIGNNLDMLWFNPCSKDMKNYRLTNASIKVGKDAVSFYEGYINRFVITGTNYTIFTGSVLGIPAYGSGFFNMSLEGVTIRVVTNITTYEKDGDIYVYSEQLDVSTTIAHVSYYFDNIQSPCVDDMNAYINQNSPEFTQHLIPFMNIYYGAFVNYALHIITTKIPLNVLYLP